MNKLLGLTLLTLSTLGACSGTSVNVSQGVATTAEMGTANKVKAYASSTPPSGATSMGMMSSPTAGGITVPITNVEVFVFTANVDDDPSPETLYWASDGTAVYVWGAIDLECVDDAGTATGETGSADFVYEADANDWGWMTSTDSCGYATLFGCSDDGSGEVCGGCDWNEDFIACVAAS